MRRDILLAAGLLLGQSPFYDHLRELERERREGQEQVLQDSLPVVVAYRPGKPLAWVTPFLRKEDGPSCAKGDSVILNMEDQKLWVCSLGVRVPLSTDYALVLSYGRTQVVEWRRGVAEETRLR